MDAIIHRHEEESGMVVGRGEVAKEEDGHVMVPVEENEGLLAQDDEKGVNELKELGEDEQHGPKANVSLAVRVGGVRAVTVNIYVCGY